MVFFKDDCFNVFVIDFGNETCKVKKNVVVYENVQ